MTDFATARRMMVDGQVRTADVTDLRLIAAMQEIPRERFVPPAQAQLAYLDIDLPAGEGQAPRRMLKPMVLAKLLQAADVSPADHALVVGCAAGYSAAVLARLAGSVVALEQDASLAKAAAVNLGDLPNVKVATGELTAGSPQSAPYDVILLDGATEIAPDVLCRQLKPDGRLVCVQGSGPGSRAMLYRRSGDDSGARPLFDAAASLLPGFVKPPAFAF